MRALPLSVVHSDEHVEAFRHPGTRRFAFASILQGELLTRLLQGAAAGAVATMFVGFYWGGWSLGSTADKMAKERSDLARLGVGTCVR